MTIKDSPLKPAVGGRNPHKYDELVKYSDPARVAKNAKEYFGDNTKIYISNKPTKKYMVEDPQGKWVHFGEMGYQDFTRHMDRSRQERYLKRALNIRGNWMDNMYSKNMLAINLLWM
jgi:hypothetical protein